LARTFSDVPVALYEAREREMDKIYARHRAEYVFKSTAYPPGHFKMYWSPGERAAFRRPCFDIDLCEMPDDAILLGTYSRNSTKPDFRADLFFVDGTLK
jgi:hypothetical protein